MASSCPRRSGRPRLRHCRGWAVMVPCYNEEAALPDRRRLARAHDNTVWTFGAEPVEERMRG